MESFIKSITSRLLRAFRRFADRVSLGLVQNKWFSKLVRYLSYQRKRMFRREIEARLRAAGRYGDEVLSGPFRGMVYPDPKHWASCRFEKIIGCYEAELHQGIEELVQFRKRYTDVIVVGAAEGYYAVGFALLFDDARVHAFEPSEQRVTVMKELARANSVEDQLTIGGFCTPDILAELPVGDSPLVVCDVDGAEELLMDPAAIPWLSGADVILELHDFLVPGISETVRKRFELSHDIDVYRVNGIRFADYPVLENLSMLEIQAMTESDRPCIHNWYVMRSCVVPSRQAYFPEQPVPAESTPEEELVLTS